MSEEMNIHDLIDRYLKGELGRDELDAFRNKMRNEPEFAREVELHKALVDSISEERKKELKAFMTENANVEYIGNIWSQRWVYASAAIIALFVGLFFILKYTLPENNLADSKEQKESSNEPAFKAEHNAISDKYKDPDDTILPGDTAVPPELVNEPLTPVAETAEEDEEVDEVLSIRRMGQIEETLDAESIDANEVGKEELLEKKTLPMLVISKSTIEPEDLKEVAVTTQESQVKTTEERKGLFKRKKSKDEEDTSVSEGGAYDNVEVAPEFIKSTSNLSVEFWKNPVNAVGYEFNGKLLKLYGVGANESLELRSYLGHVYLKRGGAYYRLVPASEFRKFSNLNEQSLIDILNQ